MNNIVIYCDGGSRGNPGPAAIGIMIEYGGEQNKEADRLANEAMDAQRENPKFDF